MALSHKTANLIRSAFQKLLYLKQYIDSTIELNSIKRSKAMGVRHNSIAVVLHLYHLDNWPLFCKALRRLQRNGCQYDLFITMPHTNLGFEDTIKQTFGEARVIAIRNRGRDVRPFVMTATLLRSMGYTYALKLHSKKSTHRNDGNEWLEGMVRDLVPSSRSVQEKLEKILSKENTGVVGPSEVYYPLTVNFPANGVHMTRVVNKIFDNKTAQSVLQDNRKDYGFFAGTMFWIRLDTIDKLLDPRLWEFEGEAGQIDGTFAHALERLFCIIPEIKGYNLYEANSKGISKRQYKSLNIPEWSKDHNK